VYCWQPPEAAALPLQEPASSARRSAFVALLGDALHFFPPDVGQARDPPLYGATAADLWLGLL